LNNTPKLRDENLKEVKKKMNALQTKAEKIIETIEPFSFVAFEEAFFNSTTKSSTATKSRILADRFKNTINKLKTNDQVGTASSYQTTINSIDGYKKNLQIQDITPAFLKSYEKHLLGEQKSLATIGIYMRNLRANINEAIKADLVSKDK
jgi:hypothetical protein